jgi:F-type H+-transporting ATPase subunit a
MASGDSLEAKLDPVKQFEIQNWVTFGSVGDVEIAFTNSAFFMFLAVAIIAGFLMMSTRGHTLIPSRAQSVAELSYEFIANLVRQMIGHDAMKLFPFVFSLFFFILMLNLLGMFPYFFTVTSQVIITGVLSLFVIGLVIVIGFAKHGLGFLKLFMPSGVPMVIAPFITTIEVISFFARPVSLSLRLFGNMLAGHIVLKVFAGFVVSMSLLGVGGIIGAIAPFLMTVALTAFEFLIAFLQAFVFTVLTCVYLRDAMHPAH